MIYIVLFWIFLGTIVYNYIGYTIILAFFNFIKNIFTLKKPQIKEFQPEVTLIIPAYNEIDYIESKVQNTNNLNYPKNKLKVIWVTDGSDDGTPEKLKEIEGIEVFHKDKRSGKIGAVNRVMKLIKTPYVIFCDANSILNEDCITEILAPFNNMKVGCVAGQKNILSLKEDKAVGAGEGIYWNYESIIKQLESNLNSSVGAAGELFALKTSLFEEIPGDSVIEDFVIALSVIRKKHKVKYTKKAISVETASVDINEELKRKVRIAYGSIQTFFRYLEILNPFKYGFFSFQYFSHKILRWTLVPIFIPLVLIFNFLIVFQAKSISFYTYTLALQLVFYVLSILGFLLKSKKTQIKIFFIPFYILVMNLAMLKGYIRYINNNQSVTWEKAKRA